MKLEEYLQRLEKCPAGKLTEELGIYDNWPVLLKYDFDSLLMHFLESERYRLTQSILKGEEWHEFEYRPSPAMLRVYRKITPWSTTGFGTTHDPDEIAHSRKQMEMYNMRLILFPHNKYRKLEGTLWKEHMVPLVKEIGDMIITDGIPACFPRSIGWKPGDIDREDTDFSRIVYFP